MKIISILLNILLVTLIISKLPAIYKNWKMQNIAAPEFSISTLNGNTFKLSTHPNKLIVVFWATWCGPCTLELGRINKMIQAAELKRENVIAISIGEEKELVQKTINERQYLFDVAIDQQGKISADYNVVGTPTLVFIDENKKINWLSAGLSPILSWRIKWFLN